MEYFPMLLISNAIVYTSHTHINIYMHCENPHEVAQFKNEFDILPAEVILASLQMNFTVIILLIPPDKLHFMQ